MAAPLVWMESIVLMKRGLVPKQLKILNKNYAGPLEPGLKIEEPAEPVCSTAQHGDGGSRLKWTFTVAQDVKQVFKIHFD